MSAQILFGLFARREVRATGTPDIIFHVDVNSAFLSWTAVQRLKEDPTSTDLRTIPSIVGGDRETRHGIVTAKSIPAARLGIRTADPVAQALKKCPDLVIVPSDFALYRRSSAAFIAILKKYSDLVEQASIDEAYMDVSGTDDPVGLAGRIRDEVRETLGFTVNVGISTNKLLAKMASDFTKPDKTHTLFPEEIPEKMWPLPIGSLYGCGSHTAARLISVGIHTIGDAAALPQEYLQSVLGDKSGRYIWRSANGISHSQVTTVREEAKSCSNEITTPFDITEDNYAKEMPPLLDALSEKVSGRLIKKGLYAKTVGVMIKTSDFKRRSMQVKREDSLQSADIIRRIAGELADKLMLGEKGVFAEGLGVRLVGISTADLDHGEYRQMSLADLLAGAEDAVPETAPPRAETAEPETAPPRGETAALETEQTPAQSETPARDKQLEKQRERQARLQQMEQKIRGRFGDASIRRGSLINTGPLPQGQPDKEKQQEDENGGKS